MKTLTKMFPEGTISTVSQTGHVLAGPSTGFNITLHYRDGEDAPCHAEVDGGDDCFAEIGLWFEGKTLSDYDGVFDLPPQLADWLRELGFTVEADGE